MKTLEFTSVNRAGWPSGPWDNEPDKRQWPDAVTGMPCLIVRNECTGNLCGYVGVPPFHPLYGQQYDDANVIVHGGLSFAAPCRPGSEKHGVCHIPGPGELDDVWWLGFDCAHYMDISPAMLMLGRECFNQGTYKDFAFVQAECEQLALQLSEFVNFTETP